MIEATDHEWNEGEITQAPTHTEAGVKTYTCQNDVSHTYTEAVNATGHSHSTEWSYDETNHWHECSCGDKADVAVHSYNDGVVTKEATTTETGIMTYTCETCDYSYTEDIPKLEVVLDPIVDMTIGGETPATITTPDGGWKLGENTFSVMCKLACLVAYTEDGENYYRLSATPVEDEDGSVLYYTFDVTLTENTQIVIYIKGDIDGDGTIEGREVTQIKAVQLSDQTTQTRFTALQIMIADVDGDGEIEGREATQIKAAQLNDRVLAW